MKRKILELYNRFKKCDNKEPTYVYCQIAWNDDDSTLWVNIKLNTEEESRYKDEEIFYYADGIEELMKFSKRQDNLEFRIIDIDGFYDENWL